MVLLCAVFHLRAQTSPGDDRGAVAAIKTNLPYWGVGGTFNLGGEFRLARHWTLDLEAGLNPFDGKNDDGSYDRTFKHFRAHPEVRYWFCEAFQGHFLGLHVPFIAYNFADLKVLDLEDERRQGWGSRNWAWAGGGPTATNGSSPSAGTWRPRLAWAISISITTSIPARTAATSRKTTRSIISAPRRRPSA